MKEDIEDEWEYLLDPTLLIEDKILRWINTENDVSWAKGEHSVLTERYSWGYYMTSSLRGSVVMRLSLHQTRFPRWSSSHCH